MMSFTVGVTDEIWNAFVDAYERNRGTTSTTYNELQNETCRVMRDAIKAYAMSSNDKTKEERDASVMIPVHDWIWQDFKWAYTKRNKGKKDDELIEVVHDWACRAMQYYTQQNIDDPWTIMEAYKMALDCPDIRIRREHGIWIIEAPHMFDVEAKSPSDLLRKVRSAKEYIEASHALNQEPRKHRSARDIIREAYEIAKTCPAMIVEELRHGWRICFEDDDYSVEALDAEHLLAEVKEARQYWEASQKPKKKNTEQTREIIREAMEKAKNSDGEVIRVDGLDQETKELLLYFIESLTIKDVSDILQRDYPCSEWDELHFIREKLRKSIAESRRDQ